RLTGGAMNSDGGSGGSGGAGNSNDVGTSGGKYSDDGRAGSGGEGYLPMETLKPRGAAKYLARRSSTEGGDSEMSGDGGGVGKARSLSTSASDGKA
ncbi:hypothetical protein Tco_0238824, partial [Tanacetum coccineum]